MHVIFFLFFSFLFFLSHCDDQCSTSEQQRAAA
jgi:hypothetical protein